MPANFKACISYLKQMYAFPPQFISICEVQDIMPVRKETVEVFWPGFAEGTSQLPGMLTVTSAWICWIWRYHIHTTSYQFVSFSFIYYKKSWLKKSKIKRHHNQLWVIDCSVLLAECSQAMDLRGKFICRNRFRWCQWISNYLLASGRHLCKKTPSSLCKFCLNHNSFLASLVQIRSRRHDYLLNSPPPPFCSCGEDRHMKI